MRVFISYESGDAARAVALADAIGERGCEVFVDRQSLSGGEHFDRRIMDELSRSDCVLVLWSLAASRSIWVNKEIAAAAEFNRRIVPVSIDETTPHPLLGSIHKLNWAPDETAMERVFETLGIRHDRGDTSNRRRVERAARAYREAIRPSYARIGVLGSKTDLPFADVYVPQRIMFEKEGSAVVPVEALLGGGPTTRTIILGTPGSGKTTLLRYLTYRGALDGTELLPIYTSIPKLLMMGKELGVMVVDALAGRVGIDDASLLVEGKNTDARLVLFMDGIDEIPETDYRGFVSTLERFLNRYPRASVVMTSRFAGFMTEDFEPFRIGLLLPLDEDQIRRYIDLRCPPSVQERVWSTIRNHERLFQLAQTPFMLAMICAAPNDVGLRATQRATLFRVCTEYLLGSRGTAYGRSAPKTSTVAPEVVLRAIAVRFFKLDFDDDFRDEELVQAIQLIPGCRSNAPDVLSQLASTTGLLQRTRGGYSFVHRSLWEFFVAEGMRDEPLGHLMNRASVSSWEEPIRLFVGLTPTHELGLVLEALWEHNQGLTLRSMNEVAPFPSIELAKLYSRAEKDDRLRILRELRSSLRRSGSAMERQRMLLDTASAMAHCERDCEVLYQLLTMLDEDGSARARDIVEKVLDLGASEQRLEAYISDTRYNLQFVETSGGTFAMGSDSAPDPRERPAHCVTVSPFAISANLVTNALYYHSFPFGQDRRNEYSNADSQPVNSVSWYEAAVFARWLACDLPTEAEWEFACRAGGQDDEVLSNAAYVDQCAWYGANSLNRTHPVGSKVPNSLGIYDMLGNLREWCKDWHSDAYYLSCQSSGDQVDPSGPTVGANKVLRGGTFDWAVTNLRPTYRNCNVPANVYFANGFRVLRRRGRRTTPSSAGSGENTCA